MYVAGRTPSPDSTSMTIADPSLASPSALIPLRVHVEQRENDPARDVVLEFECDWDVGIGGSVWTSGEILTSHLGSQQREYRALFEDKVVVELGSGTGFVGLMVAACLAPKRVVLTDLASHVACMQRNIDRNAKLLGAGVDVRAAELAWGDDAHESALLATLGEGVDVILGTDVAYLRELYEPLLHTLRRLATASTLVLLGMNRTDTDSRFFRRLEEDGFEYYKIADRLLPGEYCGKDFGLFEIRRRRVFTRLVEA